MGHDLGKYASSPKLNSPREIDNGEACIIHLIVETSKQEGSPNPACTLITGITTLDPTERL